MILVGLTGGCARYYWSKSGATAEQFSRDSRDCVQQAIGTLPGGSAANADAIETLYRACLSARGYVRDKQYDPLPPGSYRGIESGEEFTAARTTVGPPVQSFEQQLNQLDDLKARSRISGSLRRGRPVIQGYVDNDYGGAAVDVRLLVETLDGSGAVTARAIGFVRGVVPFHDRTYFEVPVKTAGASYRVSLTTFDWRRG